MDQIESLIARIEEKFGKLDILINNAATNPYFGEMAGAVLYLVSDAASYTTGTTIVCDGGSLA